MINLSIESSSTVILAIPTKDNRAIIRTVVELLRISDEVGKALAVVVGEGSNIPRSRNSIVRRISQQMPGVKDTRVLWVDSDIVLPKGAAVLIGDAIRWADANATNITANYLMANGANSLLVNRDAGDARHYADTEIEAMRNYAEIGMADFGFLYIHQPLNYVFHAGLLGEDINFWLDNPDVAVRLAKQIPIGHSKETVLWNQAFHPGGQAASHA